MAKKENKSNIYLERDENNPFAPAGPELHHYGENLTTCHTDSKGYATPKNKGRTELIIDRSEGFIPLWKKNSHLRWRFSPTLYNFFKSPERAMAGIRQLFAAGLQEWGDAPPVRFTEREDAWDFEIIVHRDNCSAHGCTLARAFFPDSGRHQLILYPKLFQQSPQEQKETMAHELGHIFGLRHFFAEVKEKAYPSVKFGVQNPFTIMNYGTKSKMTVQDQRDLKLLYESVWSGKLSAINGTRIVLFAPYHELGSIPMNRP